jgi:hypothetical protein
VKALIKVLISHRAVLVVVWSQYKDKSVVLERERFEALSALEMKGDEINRLKTELDTALEGKKFLEEELASVRCTSHFTSLHSTPLLTQLAIHVATSTHLSHGTSPNLWLWWLWVCSAQLEVMEAERVAEGDRSSGFGVFETPAVLKEKVLPYPTTLH